MQYYLIVVLIWISASLNSGGTGWKKMVNSSAVWWCFKLWSFSLICLLLFTFQSPRVAYLLLCNKLLKNLAAYTHNYPTASAEQESGSVLHGSSTSGSLTSCCSQGAGWAAGILRPNWGRIYFQAHVVVGRIQFLEVCLTEGLGSFLPFGQRLPSVRCHVGLSNMAAYFIKSTRVAKAIESASKTEGHNLL